MAKIAIIGGGISGLGAAWALDTRHEIVLYESGARLGGHANTSEIDDDGRTVPVDTAFVTYNIFNYPNLVKLFEHLDVPTEWSDMSFSWSLDRGKLEFQGRTGGFFAQPANLARPAHWRMLLDFRRFCREAPALLSSGSRESLGHYLDREGYGRGLRNDLLAPLIAAVWSSSVDDMLDHPAVTMIRFLQSHAVLELGSRQRWRTVSGGSREYIRRLSAQFADHVRLSTPVTGVRRDESGVTVYDDRGEDRFDDVVFATHADTTLAILGQGATEQERALLGAFRFRDNIAVLHRDPALMPANRRVWSAWNYLTDAKPGHDPAPSQPVSVTYWMNRLQNLETVRPVFVSVNPLREPRGDMTVFHYSHPLFDRDAIDAQDLLPHLQGKNRTWFAGAWGGYGFHEDGLRSGLEVAASLGAPAPWGVEPKPSLVSASA